MELVGFEYKKILGRKSIIIVFVLSVAIMVAGQTLWMLPFMPSYREGETRWESFLKQREYARALSGRVIDAELLMETSAAYTNRLPYFWPIERMMNWIYGRPEIAAYQAENFYNIRRHQVAQQLEFHYEAGHMSRVGVDAMLRLDERIPEPWVFEYAEGYIAFLQTGILTILAALITAVGVAPIFASEHSTGVSQLILTTKHGKGRLVRAKAFAAVSFTAMATLFLIAVHFLVNMAIFGFDGASAPFQLFIPFSPYPINMWQASLIFTVTATIRIIFFGTALLLLSSKMKSAFGVMIFAVVWIFLAMMLFVPVPITWLFNLIRLFINILPAGSTVFLPVPYEIFGLAVLPFVFEIIVAIVASAVLLTLAGRGFKRHQVG